MTLRFKKGEIVVWPGQEPQHIGEVTVVYGVAVPPARAEYCVRFADPGDETRERDFVADCELREPTADEVQAYRRIADYWRREAGESGWWDGVPLPDGGAD